MRWVSPGRQLNQRVLGGLGVWGLQGFRGLGFGGLGVWGLGFRGFRALGVSEFRDLGV